MRRTAVSEPAFPENTIKILESDLVICCVCVFLECDWGAEAGGTNDSSEAADWLVGKSIKADQTIITNECAIIIIIIIQV